MNRIKLAYLASGGGSSIEELVKKIKNGSLDGFESKLIICDKEKGSAGVYERARELGILIFQAKDPEYQFKILSTYPIDLILGLGFVKKVSNKILDKYKDRVLNIHPTLLPKHGGKGMYDLATHMAVLESGDEYTGATVHLMDPEYDKGKILRQIKVPVPEELIGKPSIENAKKLQQYVLSEEYQLMPEVLRRIRDGQLSTGYIRQ
ncbi:MAG: hypothetical protein KC589_11485 [Nanoarchaeota archaeon]|nr:hypothetical protein [Nanoarchaeota archaeon]